MRLLSLVAVLGLILIVPLAAVAEEGERVGAAPFSRIQPEKLAEILTSAGYDSQVGSDQYGKYLSTNMSGFTVLVFPYDCQNTGCSSMQFWTGFGADPSLTVEFANAWNTQWRFAKANVDSNGNFSLSQDVYFDGGVTPENIAGNARLFDYLLGELQQFNP